MEDQKFTPDQAADIVKACLEGCGQMLILTAQTLGLKEGITAIMIDEPTGIRYSLDFKILPNENITEPNI